MRTTVKKTETEVEISVFVPLEEVNEYFKKAAFNLSKKKPIKGFRPGMAPFEVVKNYFGNSAILDEFLNITLKDTFDKAIKQNDFSYIGKPKIDIIKLSQGDNFEYRITYPIFPEFEIGNFENQLKITLPKKPEVTEKEINQEIDYIINSRAKIVKVSRKSKKGDYVNIDFAAKIGGVLIENGYAKNYGFILGKGSFVPGFEEALEEMAANEERRFSLDIPSDYQHKEIAGKRVDFEVKMNAVFERQLPQLTDSFVKNLGNFSSVEELKKSLQKGLLIEKTNEQRNKIREDILTKLRTIFSFSISPLLIEQEALNLLDNFKENIQFNGLLWGDYLKKMGTDEKKVFEDLKKEAEKRIKNFLILEKIAKEKNIEADEKEITAKANDILKHYYSINDALQDFQPEELKNRVRQEIIYEKVFNLLEKIVGYEK